ELLAAPQSMPRATRATAPAAGGAPASGASALAAKTCRPARPSRRGGEGCYPETAATSAQRQPPPRRAPPSAMYRTPRRTSARKTRTWSAPPGIANWRLTNADLWSVRRNLQSEICNLQSEIGLLPAPCCLVLCRFRFLNLLCQLAELVGRDQVVIDH